MYVQIEDRVCGSSPTVGSSRNSTRGEWSKPRAISSLRFMPPEKVATRSLRRSQSPTISSTCCIRSATRSLRHAVELGVEPQVLLGGEVGVERRVLEHEADVAAHLSPLRHDVVTGDGRVPAGRVDEGAEDADGGRFPGAVGPEEPERLARRDLEVDPGYRRTSP